MRIKQVLSGIMALGLVSVMSVGSFAQVDKQVTVYKDIKTNEMYTGMGAHASKVFAKGIVVNNEQELKLVKVKTQKIWVGIVSGNIYELTLNGEKGKFDDSTYEFDFSGNKAPMTTNDGRKYYAGESKIAISGMKIHKDKHVELQIND